MSSRNVAEGVDDRILNAAARLLATSARRPPIAELARQAGVSRPTVYRRFPDGDAVVRALWEREIRRLLERTARPRDTRESLVEQIVELADRISAHEALVHTFATDPALIVRYIVERLGAGQQALLDVLRDAVRRAQSGRSIRAGDPDELAAMTLLIAQSAIQSRRMIAAHLPGDSWRCELARALHGYLQP